MKRTWNRVKKPLVFTALGIAVLTGPLCGCGKQEQKTEQKQEEKKELTPEEKEKLNEKLHDAIKKGQGSGVIRSLLKRGADINAKNNQGSTPLWNALYLNKTDEAKALIEAGANVNEQDDVGRVFVLEAVARGHEDVVDLAIKKGADINAKGPKGETPLMRAISVRKLPMVEYLIKKNADVNATNDMGQSCMWLAWSHVRSNSTIVKALIEAGADLNAKSPNGGILIIDAVDSGLESIVDMMVKKEVDVNATDGKGQTALMHAVYRNKTRIAEILLSAQGINVNLRDDRGGTALSRAERKRNSNVVELLKQHGAVEEEE